MENLSDIYEMMLEDYRGLGRDQSPSVKGMQPTYEKPNLSIRDNKIGTQVADMYAQSLTGDVAFGNPQEQEETEDDSDVSEIPAIVDGILMNLTEKSSSHTDFKAVMDLLKQAMKAGLVRAEETKNGYMIKSLVDTSQFLIHKGGSNYHPLRRYLNTLQKVS